MYTAPEGTEDSVFFSQNYRWDGVIVRVTSDSRARRVLALGVPAVSIGSVRMKSRRLPRVRVDDEKLTALAARHLRGGLRRFAYCNYLPRRADEDRGPAFARHVAADGCPCDFYCEFSRLKPGASWQARQRDLARWVRRLDKPVGVFTWNADIACQVVEACHRAGVEVPGEVAVFSGDEDMKCELSRPTISAIEIPAERIGYEAAALLDRMMSGAAAPTQVLIEPSGVIAVRESSKSVQVDGWEVHRAVRFLREHAAEAITVDAAAREVQVSRRWLERHFQRLLGRTPHDELRAARLGAGAETPPGDRVVAGGSGASGGADVGAIPEFRVSAKCGLHAGSVPNALPAAIDGRGGFASKRCLEPSGWSGW